MTCFYLLFCKVYSSRDGVRCLIVTVARQPLKTPPSQTAEKRFYSSFHGKGIAPASRNMSPSKKEGFGVLPVSNV